ncbi:MAG: HAD family hydrolase [Elainellaceae cyanobacterium]
MTAPDILAFDFDGVICDGLIEYFQTAWNAYCRIWKPDSSTPPDGLAERFYRLRPVVETGWEMPLVLRSLLMGMSDEEILDHWQAIAHQQVKTEGIDPAQLAALVDGGRDEWIARDVDNWLAQHRFYPGILDRLQQLLASSTQVMIITTKEGRFVKQLLHQQAVEIPADAIYGKEIKQPKHQTLRQLQATASSPEIWFVEDRLKTLQSVKSQPDLESVKLFLADWGYNTQGDRTQAEQDDCIQRLSLDQLAQPLSAWMNSH